MKNKLIIACAGAGKTTFLVNQALKIKEKTVLITTYTEDNKEEIEKKMIGIKGNIPKNIVIKTWFSFLLEHGVRPYQSVLNKNIFDSKIGFFLTEKASGFRFKSKKGFPIYWGELDFDKYYFTDDYKIYSDKIGEFIIKSNDKCEGEIINRISNIFDSILIDEIQDLAGWELEIIKLLFYSNSNVLLVGDPRQVTYLTHHAKKYKKYSNGKINEFIINECNKGVCDIDYSILGNSHRNNNEICIYSSKLFPYFDKTVPCTCEICRSYSITHEGIYFIKKIYKDKYIEKYKPTTLKWKNAIYPERNFGKSKGLTFDRVLIEPTKEIKEWIEDNNYPLKDSVRCKFYVALTRARFSVCIVYDYNDKKVYDGVEKLIL